MKLEHKLQILVEKAGARVISCAPQQGFVAPRRITVVDTAGIHHFKPNDWHEIEWTGTLPTGFTTQTCFLFAYEDGNLMEIKKRAEPEPVVI